MGLFDAFKKKNCDICGGEIGLLGNRKLEDGNMCKHCARKLSPWFDERRHSTIEQIKAQLEYREENKSKVAEFRTTRVFGESEKLYLDEDSAVFLVTSADESDWADNNPDVVPFADVTGVEWDVSDYKTEIQYRNKEGEMVSYNPPRYTYHYDFDVIINVRHPYFDDMKFRINKDSVCIERQDFGKGNFFGGSRFNPEYDPQYRYYKEMGEEIKQALLNVRQQARDTAAAAAAPKSAVTCPWCGATTMPDANGCCEYCGGALNG